MSLQDITGKREGELTTSVNATVLYSLSHEWLAYCQALTVQVSDVQELAAQGSVVEAFRHLSERLAGIDRRATAAVRPAGAPFVLVVPVATSGPSAELSPAMRGAAAAAPAQSAPSDVPTAALAGAAGAAEQRALPVSPAGKSRGFRALVRSRFVLVPSVDAPRISMRIFVLKQVSGGSSNATA